MNCRTTIILRRDKICVKDYLSACFASLRDVVGRALFFCLFNSGGFLNLFVRFGPFDRIAKGQSEKSAQGILRLWNPNLRPNSGKRILDARILDPNSWAELFDNVLSSKRGP